MSQRGINLKGFDLDVIPKERKRIEVDYLYEGENYDD